jgi:hypothetical protein
MRTLVYLLFAGLTLGAVSPEARADKCTDMKANEKPPIPFVPVDRTDPETGLPYEPAWLLTHQIMVNGHLINLKEMFDSIDHIEQTLTTHGYTLRGATPETLAELGVCPDLLRDQGAILDIMLHDPAGPLSENSVRAKIEKAIELAASKVPNWSEVYEKVKNPEREIYLPRVPSYTAPTPTPKRSALKPLFKERSWAWDMGEKDSLWVQVQASFRIDGNTTAVKAAASGAVKASVLGQWEGEVLGVQATGDIGESHVAALGINVRAVGKSVFARSWNKSWSDGPLQEHDEKRFDVRQEADYRFAIGPIPCKGTIGFVGAAGIKYGFDIVPIQISAFAVPFVASKVFAQVGVDLVVVSGGVGGELTLINDDVTLQGGASLTFDDDPTLTLELTGKNTIEALSGKLYAFAKVGVWPLDWEGRFTFYEWKGYKKDSDLFKFRTTWGPSGITAEGDLTAEDVMEVTADTQERRLTDLENTTSGRAFEVFDAIARDLNTPAAAAVRAENARHEAISHAIDDTIAQYWAELARSGA